METGMCIGGACLLAAIGWAGATSTEDGKECRFDTGALRGVLRPQGASMVSGHDISEKQAIECYQAYLKESQP